MSSWENDDWELSPIAATSIQLAIRGIYFGSTVSFTSSKSIGNPE